MTASMLTGAVLAALPEGKARRQRTPSVASTADLPVQDVVGELMRLNAAGIVGRMERDGVESWWRWPAEATADVTEGAEMSGQEEINLDDLIAEEAATDDRDYAVACLRDLIAPFFSGTTIPEQIDMLNRFRGVLAELSPMHLEPVDYVRWVPTEIVTANDYNPNSVAPPEMELLRLSIMADGYTQPVVAAEEGDGWTVIDGFHRNRVARECEDVRTRIHGYLPVVGIREDREDRGDRIAATIRHNRARGKHQVMAMSDIVLELKRRNWSDEKIGKQLGMDPDEVLRLAQISGLADAFKDRDFSLAWEVELLGDEELEEVDMLTGEITKGGPGE